MVPLQSSKPSDASMKTRCQFRGANTLILCDKYANTLLFPKREQWISLWWTKPQQTKQQILFLNCNFSRIKSLQTNSLQIHKREWERVWPNMAPSSHQKMSHLCAKCVYCMQQIPLECSYLHHIYQPEQPFLLMWKENTAYQIRRQYCRHSRVQEDSTRAELRVVLVMKLAEEEVTVSG